MNPTTKEVAGDAKDIKKHVFDPMSKDTVCSWGSAWAEYLSKSFCRKDDTLIVLSPEYMSFQCKIDPSPEMPIQTYIDRILKHVNMSLAALYHAMVYVARIHDPVNFPVTSLTVHRIVLAAIRLATKYYDDGFCDNARFAEIGGVPKKDMNEMEITFFNCLGFNLFPAHDDYEWLIQNFNWVILPQSDNKDDKESKDNKILICNRLQNYVSLSKKSLIPTVIANKKESQQPQLSFVKSTHETAASSSSTSSSSASVVVSNSKMKI